MSSKSALKKKSRASLAEDAPKRKSEGSDDERENIDAAAAPVEKKKKAKAHTVSEALTEVSENSAKAQDKKAEKVPRSMSVASGTDMQAKYDRLKARFDELKTLRTTEAEALLEQQKEHIQAKEKASAALIAALKKEKEQLASLIARTSEARLAALEAKVAFYEQLSGVAVRHADDAKHAYACTYSVRGEKALALDFDLVMKDDGQVEYAPKIDANGKELASLPEYLREEIVFGAKELPVFLSKMQNHMYKSAA